MTSNQQRKYGSGLSKADARQAERQRLLHIGWALEKSIQSFKEGERKGLTVSAEGKEGIRESQRQLSNIYSAINSLDLAQNIEDRARLFTLEKQLREGHSGEWDPAWTSELQQIRVRLGNPSRQTTFRRQSPDQIRARVDAAQQAADRKAAKEEINMLWFGQPSNPTAKDAALRRAEEELRNPPPKTIGEQITRTLGGAAEAPTLARRAIADVLSNAAGNGIISPEIYEQDDWSRFSNDAADWLEYAIPGYGTAKGYIGLAHLAASAATNPKETWQSLVKSHNVFERGISREEQVERALTLFGTIYSVGHLSLRGGSSVKVALDNGGIRAKLIEGGMTLEQANLTIAMARDSISSRGKKIDTGYGKQIEPSLRERVDAASGQLRRGEVEKEIGAQAKDRFLAAETARRQITEARRASVGKVKSNRLISKYAKYDGLPSELASKPPGPPRERLPTPNGSLPGKERPISFTPWGEIRQGANFGSDIHILRPGESGRPYLYLPEILTPEHILDFYYSNPDAYLGYMPVDRAITGVYYNSETGAKTYLHGHDVGLTPEGEGIVGTTHVTSGAAQQRLNMSAKSGGFHILGAAALDNVLGGPNGTNIFRAEVYAALERYHKDEILEEINRGLFRAKEPTVTSIDKAIEAIGKMGISRRKNALLQIFGEHKSALPAVSDILNIANDPRLSGLRVGDAIAIVYGDAQAKPILWPDLTPKDGNPLWKSPYPQVNPGAYLHPTLHKNVFEIFPEDYLRKAQEMGDWKVDFSDITNTGKQVNWLRENDIRKWLFDLVIRGGATGPDLEGLFQPGSFSGERGVFHQGTDSGLAALGSRDAPKVPRLEASPREGGKARPRRSVSWQKGGGHEYFGENGDRRKRLGGFDQGGNTERGRYARNVGRPDALVAESNDASNVRFTSLANRLQTGVSLLGQAHGPQLAKVAADDIARHPAAAAQAMAHLASGDKRFREALADNGHEPDRFAAMLRSGAAGAKPVKTAVAQLASIYA